MPAHRRESPVGQPRPRRIRIIPGILKSVAEDVG